jgi:hypothetical protein
MKFRNFCVDVILWSTERSRLAERPPLLIFCLKCRVCVCASPVLTMSQGQMAERQLCRTRGGGIVLDET